MKRLFFLLLALFILLVGYIVYDNSFSVDTVSLDDESEFDASRFMLDQGFVDPDELPKTIELQDNFLNPEEAKADLLLINFWATWCAPCIKELPDLNDLGLEMGGKPFKILAVAVSEGEEKIRPFLVEKEFVNFKMRFIADSEQEFTRQFEIPGVPSTFVIKSSGEVISATFGIRPWNESNYKQYLDHILEN